MKVLFQFQGLITDEYRSFFKKNVPSGVDLVFSSESEPDDLANQMSDVDIYVGYTISEKLLSSAERLKHIQIPWTGFDRLNTSLLEGKEISVSNSHANSLAIAEHAVALMLAASKLLTIRDSKMRKGDWSTRTENVESFWLTGKTLGVVGYGAIGKKVAKMLKYGFDMKVLALKRHPGEHDDLCDKVYGQDGIKTLLEQSDFILVATPLTDETKGLIGEQELGWMKSTGVLVNIARGPVIDEQALFDSLKQRTIGAAGIDVWYNYPSRGETVVKQNFPFEELENIVMTPHSAFKVRERVEVFAQDILENIKRISQNEEPINQVYLELGY